MCGCACLKHGSLLPSPTTALWNACTRLSSSLVWCEGERPGSVLFAVCFISRISWWIGVLFSLDLCLPCVFLPTGLVPSIAYVFSSGEREAFACCTTLLVAPAGSLPPLCVVVHYSQLHLSHLHVTSWCHCLIFFFGLSTFESLRSTFLSFKIHRSSSWPHRPFPTLIWAAAVIFEK